LGKVLGGTQNAAEQKMRGAAFAGIYRQWREDLLEAEADDEKLAPAFGEFFSRKPTIQELGKLLHDQYGQVDFHVLEAQLRESCAWAGCPVPRSDLHEALYGWVRDLRTLLEDSPEYRDRFQLPLQNAIRELGQYEAVIRNDSVALKQYLASVVKQHRYVRFAGMAEVSGPDEVEMSRVFVMPRVVERIESGAREAEPAAASTLLAGKKAPRRLVILGGPGWVWFSYWTRSFKPRGQPCATGEVSTRLRVPIGHLGQEPVVARCAPPLLPSTLRRSVSSAPQTDSCK
jgi:hypothetical protein